MNALLTLSDYRRIVSEQLPLIDVRSPIEFERGAFINSTNLPLMDDEERRQVGTCYKNRGSEAAIELGHQLVSGSVKQKRIENWKNHLKLFPNSIVYCFRGGMRSEISQRWIFEELHREVPRVEGGYKAFRNYLLSMLEPSQIKSKPVILGGYTGSGKTQLLRYLDNAVDLEKIANHRGSSFGAHITAQPNQINFENNLAYALIRHQNAAYEHLIVEDEGRNIGKCFMPKALATFLAGGDFIILESSLEQRTANTIEEYVILAQKKYNEAYSDGGFEQWKLSMEFNLTRIKKRLGGALYQELNRLFQDACKHQRERHDITMHSLWVSELLTKYYDPMYRYQIEKNTQPVLFRGYKEEVLDFFCTNCASNIYS